MPYVSNDADHRQPRAGDDADALAQRVLIGPERPRHGLVDDYYRRRLRIVETFRKRLLLIPWNDRQGDTRIGVGEKSAFPQWHFHRPRVIVADSARGAGRLLAGMRRGAPHDVKGEPIITRSERRL